MTPEETTKKLLNRHIFWAMDPSNTAFELNYTELEAAIVIAIRDAQPKADQIKILADEMKTASKLLNGIKSELSASVYTVEDDEFETIYFVRDMLDKALKDAGIE